MPRSALRHPLRFPIWNMISPNPESARGSLDPSWSARVGDYLKQPQMLELSAFLRAEKRAGKVIYPAPQNIFAAFKATPFDAVKVVILGQDPYHGPNQAQGLSFSVPVGARKPPSLLNIMAETKRDLHGVPADHGCLLPWAHQGILLLNAVLTVEAGHAGSHQGKGWEGFTDTVVECLDRERESLVFMLWGSSAQAKGKFIDTRRHLVLKAPHPSPLSAHRGFIGCGHFSAANRWLEEHALAPIDWQLPPATELAMR